MNAEHSRLSFERGHFLQWHYAKWNGKKSVLFRLDMVHHDGITSQFDISAISFAREEKCNIDEFWNEKLINANWNWIIDRFFFHQLCKL